MKSTTKVFVLALCFGAMSNAVWAQQPPNLRSAKSGNWDDLDTWEQEDTIVSGLWVRSDHVPSAADGQITIQRLPFETHRIEITSFADVIADELVVNGQLRVRGSTLKIANGPTQEDLSVSATGVLEVGQGAEGGLLKLQNGAGCEVKQAGNSA